MNEKNEFQDQDDIVFKTIERRLRKAKQAAEYAQATERIVFQTLDDMCISPEDVPSDAENAETLQDAITCWLQYDEYSLHDIMREVRGAYGMGEADDNT